MLDVEFEDEIDIKNETKPVEVTAEGNVDNDGNVTDLRITSIYCHSLKKSIKFDTLIWRDNKRILEKAQVEIIKKYQEEERENAVEIDDAADFFASENDGNEEIIERITSNKEHPYKH